MKNDELNADRYLSLGNVDICSSSDSAGNLYRPKSKGRQMKYLVPVVAVLLLTAGCSPTSPVFTVADRAGLGAFLAFEIVANDSGATPVPTPDGAPAGDWCDECTPGGVPLPKSSRQGW